MTAIAHAVVVIDLILFILALIKAWKSSNFDNIWPLTRELAGRLHATLIIFDCMSLVVRKPVIGVLDQVRHKPGCTATEDS